MKKALALLVLSVFLFNCSNENNTIYETEISSTFNSYKKVKFEWYNAYTTKDSLINVLNDSINSNYFDTKPYDMDYGKLLSGTRKELVTMQKELNENTEKNKIIRGERNLLFKKRDELKQLKVFDTIMQNGILTFKGDNKFYKVMVNFDNDGNYIKHSIPLDPIEFDKLLLLVEN